MPIWFSLMAHFFIGERLTKLKTTALIVGIIGLFFVMQINPFQIEWKGMALLAQLLVLLGAVSWAISNIIVKKVLETHNKWQFTAYQMVIGTVVLFLYSFFFEQDKTIIWGWEAIGILLYAGVMGSAVAYILWTYILSSGEGGKASVSLFLVPVIGIISGTIFLGERLHYISLIGIFLIIAALVLVNIEKKHSTNKLNSRKEGSLNKTFIR
jgi:drug/metabolite transporter (DMT)-like permease